MVKLTRIPSMIENKDGVKIPVFIKLGITEMRFIKHNNFYYRDGGHWHVSYIIKDGKLYADCPTIQHIDGKELNKITKKEWLKGNAQNIPSNSKIKCDLGIQEICECCNQPIIN